eukprot:9493172-Pyramimonas_sp.AAC.1
MGTDSNMWKGHVSEADLETRWQELAWRVNAELKKDAVPVGQKLVRFLEVLVQCQSSAGGRLLAVVPEASRQLATAQINIPEGEHR